MTKRVKTKDTQGVSPAFTTDSDMELSAEDFETGDWIPKVGKEPKDMTLSEKAICFHNIDAKGNPTGVVDARVYSYIKATHHMFVCGGIPYIYRDGYYQIDARGTLIKSMIQDCLLEQFVRSTTNERIYKLFLQDRDLEISPDEMDPHFPHFINFRNGMLDARKMTMHPHNPKLMSTHQIPWTYTPGADYGKGEHIEAFLHHAIPDADDREMLYEYMGLCCTLDTKQQKMMLIQGVGGTGKSTLIKLIEQLVGSKNISNVPMSKLSKDFQAISLMGKMLNSCADLEIDALDDSSMIKKLVGEDMIRDSYKGKDLVFFKNRAKMLFSVNELPIVNNEKTEGLFRRLLILSMNTKPAKEDPDLIEHLQADLPYLLNQAMMALNRMYKRGKIFESEHSKELVQMMRNDSDSVEAFLFEKCEKGKADDKIERKALFSEYVEYCKDQELTPHRKKNFFRAIRNKGYVDTTSNGARYFFPIKWKGTDKDGFLKVPAKGDIPFD